MADRSDADVNYFEIVGNVGKLRVSSPNGHSVANLAVATHRMVRDPETRRLVEHTEWHDVAAFDEVAEQVRASVQVGTRVRCTGRMRTRGWQDKDDSSKKVYKHELVAEQLEVCPREASSAAALPAATTDEAPKPMGIKIESY